ncbi:hypothetical protein [Kordia jejudonensis]|uniref:hypothetical protein n=1 Tax=Kordia jejudonensis TaxID=1348245 RepID=UPI000629526C|nr:hypothetical protein [Kordia jejudonensis]
MKKQLKTLGLKKHTISSLEETLLKGGAPTTHSLITMHAGCVSQQGCNPVPQDPRPQTGTSVCIKCGTWL